MDQLSRRVLAAFDEGARIHLASRSLFAMSLSAAATEIADRLRTGSRIFILGNGGSAADALHWTAELVGRFAFERPGIAAHALVDNASILTALGNDYGYERVFARQLEALAREGDVVLAISTSGRSPNVLEALRSASALGCYMVGFTGEGGGDMADLVDILFDVPSRSTPRIQEVHALLGHCLCELLEELLHGPRP